MPRSSIPTLVAILASAVFAPAAERPNIVLIISDDHGWPYYGFMGSEVVRTPQLDRLAAEGTVVPFTYNTSSLCAPSLRAVLTGLQPHQFALHAGATARDNRARTGERGSPIERMATLPRLLSKVGYATFERGSSGMGTTPNPASTKGPPLPPTPPRSTGCACQVPHALLPDAAFRDATGHLDHRPPLKPQAHIAAQMVLWSEGRENWDQLLPEPAAPGHPAIPSLE